jgi:hypothetical protein
MSNRLCFWDSLVFGVTASLTLWPDLPAVVVILVLLAPLGAAIVALTPERGAQ